MPKSPPGGPPGEGGQGLCCAGRLLAAPGAGRMPGWPPLPGPAGGPDLYSARKSCCRGCLCSCHIGPGPPPPCGDCTGDCEGACRRPYCSSAKVFLRPCDSSTISCRRPFCSSARVFLRPNDSCTSGGGPRRRSSSSGWGASCCAAALPYSTKLTPLKSVVQLRRMESANRALSSSMPNSSSELVLSSLSNSRPSICRLKIMSCRSRRTRPRTPQSASEEHHLDVSCGDMALTSVATDIAAAELPPAERSRGLGHRPAAPGPS
mmetsp:Transcript_68106/g.150882  ORF Transcript_68106/g.150882 Transcript_68106/m.150882 type:complete len:263 (-) Transcript_68106:16-804(-)